MTTPETQQLDPETTVSRSAMADLAPDCRQALREHGYRIPVADGRVRLAMVGQTTYFECCGLTKATDDIEPLFIDFRSGADTTSMISEIDRFAPHVILVFRPEIIPVGLFADIGALTVGFLTEPLPRATGIHHPDLERRLEYLKAIDCDNFDRIISFDPLIAETASGVVPVWRSMPIPVADECFFDVQPFTVDPRMVFVGRSTAHREMWLERAKHEFDVLHIAHGLFGTDLIEMLSQPSVSLNIHNEAYSSFENRVSICLAAGHLVISEALNPTHGLEPGIDFLEVMLPHDLGMLLSQIKRFPDSFTRMRVMGRMKAEYFRASRVYPRLLHDLYWDFGAFGTTRRQHLEGGLERLGASSATIDQPTGD